MLFNSIEFIIFFPIVVAAYFALNPRYRWVLLLIASYYFYMCWNYKYIILILISTVIDYFAALGMSRTTAKARKNLLLILSLTTNLSLLIFFKYLNFFGENINALFANLNIFYEIPLYDYLLPVGIDRKSVV